MPTVVAVRLEAPELIAVRSPANRVAERGIGQVERQNDGVSLRSVRVLKVPDVTSSPSHASRSSGVRAQGA